MMRLAFLVFTISLQAMPSSGLFSQDPFLEVREEMVVRQIEERGISHAATLAALRKVKRHLFVPGSYRDKAYEDRPLPIGYGQTISQPYIVGYMVSVIQPQSNFKVLEIGTGSGYQAAVLAEVVQEVYTIEIVEELGGEARAQLKKLGYENVHVKIGDGYEGWEEAGPFDAILVTAAAEEIPPPLLRQLKEGGKLVIPLGPSSQTQGLMLVKKKKGKMIKKRLALVRFVPFTRY